MNKYDVNHLHKVILLITDEIDRICRNNGINYSMYGGTLIGAVRHGGFIPWDDDFDIAMLREDYDRFCQICSNGLDARFDIVSIDNSDNYGYNFIKITLKGTKVLQGKYRKRRNVYSEIGVDIFPIDNVPDSGIKKCIHQFKNYFLIKLLEERFDGLSDDDVNIVKIVVYHIFGVLNKIIPACFLKRNLVENSIKYAKTETENVTSLASHYGYDREMLPRKIFGEYVELDFEGRKYRAIQDYDVFLKNVYGDYMQLPPVEERVTHGFTEIDFGEYI